MHKQVYTCIHTHRQAYITYAYVYTRVYVYYLSLHCNYLHITYFVSFPVQYLDQKAPRLV